MFDFFNRKLKQDLAERDKLIASYVADVKRLTRAQNDKVITDCHAADFVVDWEKINAFSVERHGGEPEAYTIIGYYDKDGCVDEWKFYCSLEQHNKLAKEFSNGITKKADLALRQYSTST